MKSLSKLLLTIFLPFMAISLSACDDLFENEGNINDYVGYYVTEGCRERTVRYVLGSGSEVLSEKTIEPGSGCKVIVKNDKTVVFTDKEEKEYNGTIKCMEKYCRFYNTPLSSSYKFTKIMGRLEYSTSSRGSSSGASYTETTRSITLMKVSSFD